MLQAAWDEAAATLLRLAAAGVAGRLHHARRRDALQHLELRARGAPARCARRWRSRPCPGITAMAACAAAVGRPLAEGREPLLVWPDEPPADAAALLELAPNMVFMKAGRHLDALADLAESAGAEAVAVRRASQAGAAPRRDLRAWAGDREYFTTVLMHREETP